MYTLNNGEVAYDYTHGWYDGILIDEMTLTWHDPAGVTGTASDGDTYGSDHVLPATDMRSPTRPCSSRPAAPLTSSRSTVPCACTCSARPENAANTATAASLGVRDIIDFSFV